MRGIALQVLRHGRPVQAATVGSGDLSPEVARFRPEDLLMGKYTGYQLISDQERIM